MRQSLVNLAVLTAVSCLLSCLAYPGYGQEAPASPAQTLLQQAVEYVDSCEPQLAVQACEEVIASYLEYEYDARLMLAAVYQAEGRLAEAIEQTQLALDKVTRLYPDDSQRITAAQEALARLMSAQKSFTQQLAQYERIIEQQPNTAQAVDAQYRIGSVYAFYFKYDQAIAQLTNLIEQYPKSAEAVKAFSVLQMVFAQADRPQEALKVLPELVMTHCSGNPQILLELCQFYRSQGKLGQAVALAETIAAIFPQSAAAPGALLVAAGGYRQVGRLDYAQAAAERVVADYPDSYEVTGALRQLLAIYEGREGLEAAGAKLWALAAKYPDTRVATAAAGVMNQAALSCLDTGVNLSSEGKYGEAIAQFEKPLAWSQYWLELAGESNELPANERPAYTVGRIKVSLGFALTATEQFGPATDILRELVQEGPEWAAEAVQVALLKAALEHPEIGEVELLPPRFKKTLPQEHGLLSASGHSSIVIGVGFLEPTSTSVIVIGNANLKITGTSCDLPFVKLLVGESELRYRTREHSVQITVKPTEQVGQHEGIMTIDTNDPAAPRIEVPISVTVRNP